MSKEKCELIDKGLVLQQLLNVMARMQSPVQKLKLINKVSQEGLLCMCPVLITFLKCLLLTALSPVSTGLLKAEQGRAEMAVWHYFCLLLLTTSLRDSWFFISDPESLSHSSGLEIRVKNSRKHGTEEGGCTACCPC